MFRKKILSLLTVGLLGLSLTACGGAKEEKADSEKTNIQKPEWVYVPEYHSMGDQSDLYSAVVVEDCLYYGKYDWNTETAESSYHIIKHSLLDETEESIPLDLGTGSVSSFCVGKDGGVIAVVNVWSMDETTGEDNNSTSLMAFDQNGNKTLDVDLSDVLEEQNYVRSVITDDEGRIYLALEDMVVLLRTDGSCAGKVKIGNSMNNWFNACGVGKDGKVYVSYYADNGMALCDINFDNGSVGTIYSNFTGNGGTLMPGSEKDFLITDSTTVYEYDLQSQQAEALFNWLDSDVNGMYVQGLGVLSDGRIWAISNNWETNENNVILLTKKSSDEVPSRELITIGSLYIDSDIQEAAVKFNQSNEKYRVTIKTYLNMQEWNENSYSDAITRLNNDITSGNSPDIIGLNGLNAVQLADKGVFENLYTYLEQGTSLSKEDFVQNVLEGYTKDGLLYALPKTFMIQTVAGKTSDVGSKMGWSLDDMISYADSHPEANLFNYESRIALLYYCMMYNESEFINWSTGECHFDSPEFIRLLEFVNRFPEEADYNMNVSTPTRIQNGEVLLDNAYFADFNEIQMYDEIFGGEVTFIGYPTTDGSVGCSMTGSSLYAISSKSDLKDGAWSFMESYLLDERKSHSWGFPSRKAELDKMIEEATKVETYTWVDENGVEHEEAVSGGSVSYGEDGWSYEYRPVSQEDVDRILELINVAKPAASTDDEVIKIIQEESESFFKGGKSAADAAAVIQSRVSIYVSENS